MDVVINKAGKTSYVRNQDKYNTWSSVHNILDSDRILYNTLFSREENFAKTEFEIFSREDIFANILFTRTYLPAKISSHENIFSRKYPLAKISSRENILPRKYFPAIFSVPQICRLVGLGYAAATYCFLGI